MKTLMHVVGARPNFMKVAPIWRAMAGRGAAVRQQLIHTGQHYDKEMSDVFFRDLSLPSPDFHLGVGSGSQAEQTARLLVELEKVFLAHRPDLVSVVGDVNSTLAAALVAAKLGIPVAHVEAGLRSRDRTMPEEINRLVTDQLSDCLLTPSADGDENLLKEGIPAARIFRVGNVMIDSLMASLPAAKALPVLGSMGLGPGGYAVCTLHRPANVDSPRILEDLLIALVALSQKMPVIFPVHPRTRQRLSALSIPLPPALRCIEPLGYLEFLALTSQARVVLTDSGGLQEETTALGIPCLTLRENTERPITVTQGTNTVVGTDPRRISAELDRILTHPKPCPPAPPLWDGHAGARIAEVYARLLGV